MNKNEPFHPYIFIIALRDLFLPQVSASLQYRINKRNVEELSIGKYTTIKYLRTLNET